MLKKVRKRVKDHIKHFKYIITPEQEDEIVTLYDLNHQTYDEEALSLHIENFVGNMGSLEDSNWKKERRPTVFATKVNITTLEVPNFPKSSETFNFLISRLGTDIPFCLITNEQKKSLVESMYPLIVEAGVELIVEGSFGAEMYIVESGEFDVTVKGKFTNKMTRGSVFGELSLLHGIPRTATVTSNEKSKVWSVEQTSFSCIRIRDQMHRKTMTQQAIEESGYLMNILKTSQNVSRVIDTSKSEFISSGTPYDLYEGEVVIVLKTGRVIDYKERQVVPKDLILESFYAETDLECIILDLNQFKNK